MLAKVPGRSRAPVRGNTGHKGVEAELPKVDSEVGDYLLAVLSQKSSNRRYSRRRCWYLLLLLLLVVLLLRSSVFLGFEGGIKKTSEVEKSEF